jgi:phosphoribosyl-ATP pyrophosphohydrolase/phosphoribosyl-AMP cyclohydrolase
MSEKAKVLQEVYDVIVDRREHPKEGSYTNYLFDKGIDKICKKVGEEAAEVIIAAKNASGAEIRYEVSDLLYHLMVLMVEQGVTWEQVFTELEGRR